MARLSNTLSPHAREADNETFVKGFFSFFLSRYTINSRDNEIDRIREFEPRINGYKIF